MPGPSRSTIEVGGRRLTISNLDKVLYPATGFSKAEVIDYYARIAPVMLGHLEGRAVTMRRFPDGVEGQSFYAKHVPRGAPSWLRTYRVPSGGRVASDVTAGESSIVEFVAVGDVESLLWVANLAALELHVPQWKVGPDGDPLPADLLVFDLDPGPPASVVECCRVALRLAEELRGDGMSAVAKTSGSKGLQLYARVDGGPAAAGTSTYAREMAERLERERPGEVLSNMRKSLRPGKVFIDWSQNSPAKTTVAPYSLRARPEPSVSTPVTWEEVAEAAASGDGATLGYVAPQVLRRVDEIGDLFSPLLA